MAGYLVRHPLLRKLVISTPVVRDLAWRYIAGENLDAGLRVARDLNARGIKGTLNFVGTHVHDEREAISAADAAIEALRQMHQHGIDANYSLKLTQIGLDINEDLCRTQTRRILDVARELGSFVRIDMEESRYVDTTLHLFDDMQAIYGNDTVGIVIQSYLRGRDADLPRLIANGARVRLVKGGYWEPRTVAYDKKAEVDAAFLRDAELLLRNGYRPALASHDANFIAATRRRAGELKRDRSSFEYQMLYGVRPDLQESLTREGYTVRCYIPYGGEWYAYFVGCIRKSLGDLAGRLTTRPRGQRRTARQRDDALVHA